ncbi:uncharacterized protein N0V89_009876 [Didymosphaeria variabile]|uniref:NADH-ubiquinone oxidoreductase 213 kDa subunit n=1 Tax=Didymosphaeria variabile TaxID=1932322 RepID=A0A9W8XER9_9PLEO|nr:uncharacterized protein N0V89_009876 [Didymosphaeria variabile]KAJ4348500.1 hypothetical protein N0V89_009876 [Didymosphaeria variabile]
MASHDDTYHPRDTLANTSKTALQLSVAGAIFAGVQNTLRKQNVGAMGIITRSGGIIAVFTGVGVLYQFTKDATANLRQKDDTYGEALAGFMGGTAVGGSIPMVLGAGATFGVATAAFRYTNGLNGYAIKEDDEDEVARKEEMRKMRRRPLQETLEQLGEGRGIYGPGYEERRRERLLAKYGIDVKAAQEQFREKNADTTASL